MIGVQAAEHWYKHQDMCSPYVPFPPHAEVDWPTILASYFVR